MLDFFIKRPKAAMVLSLLLVVLGGLAILNLPVSQFPQLSPPTVSISGTYTGADAVTAEQTVATPIEVQVNGVPGMDYISTNATSSGAVSISVTFEQETDIDIAALDVQNRVSIAEPILPEPVRRLGVQVRKRNPSLFMLVSIFSPDGTHDGKFLDNYANIFVKDELLRVDGIGDAFAVAKDFSMRLWLNPAAMAGYGLTTQDVVLALQEQNVQVAAGTVGAPPQYDDQAFEYTVFVDGRLEDPEEFADVIIRNDPATGALVRLSDVGRVELGTFNYGNQALTNGNPAGIIILYQAPGSNALETAAGVREAMERLSATFPPDVEYLIPFEAASIVQVSVREVVITLLIALVIVSLVVYVFLQTPRATLIPLLAIPVSIIGAFALFIPLGYTINTLTLFGFVLAIGIVVDDAIVMVEAIEKNIEDEGMDGPAAAKKALRQVAAPILATSIILAAIFVPVAFIPGLTGQLYEQFAITISVAVLLSSLVALTLAPALGALLLKAKDEKHENSWTAWFFGPFNRGLKKMNSGYTSSLERLLRHRLIGGILLVAIIGGTVWLFYEEPTGFVPPEDGGRIFATYELPEGASNSRSLAVLNQMMTMLDTVPEIENYTGVASLNAITFTERSNTGTVFIQLEPWSEREERDQSLFALLGKLNKMFSAITDARVVVIPPPPIPGLGSTSGFSFIVQDRSGQASVQEFAGTLNRFLGRINERPEITGAFSFFTAETPAYELEVDRAAAKKLGVPITDVYSTLQTYLGSRYINDFTLYGRTFRVVAQADTSYRTSIEDLEDYYVRNSVGTMVPLGNLIEYRLVSQAPLISHYNLYRSASITGNPAPGYSSGQALRALREEAELPPGYGYEFSGLSREQVQTGNTTLYLFGIAIVFAFLVLTALYESWSVPFSVLGAAPLGLFGAILVLWLIPFLNNNVYAQIGLLTIIGLAAKNAILIVEYAKRRLEEGMELREATLEAARLRLRPILMTSATFIFGMVPLALASGAGANSRRSIGFTVIGGMIAVTALAIYFVPLLYTVITRWAYGREELERLREQE